MLHSRYITSDVTNNDKLDIANAVLLENVDKFCYLCSIQHTRVHLQGGHWTDVLFINPASCCWIFCLQCLSPCSHYYLRVCVITS